MWTLSLIENAFDFILSAADLATRDTPRDWKYAMLDLANGVELILKARLEREHWSLLFSSIDKATLQKLDQGDFSSATFDQACSRLKDVVGVDIKDSDRRELDALRKLRNRITHYSVELDAAAARSLVAKCMNFCIEFCQQEDLLAEPDKTEELHRVLSDFQAFVDERKQTIAGELEGSFIWSCPTCLQGAIVVCGDVTKCRFCNLVTDPEELAEYNNLERPSSDPSDPRLDLPLCPDCGIGVIAHLRRPKGGKSFLMCSFCGESGDELVECAMCGSPSSFANDSNPDIEFCENCMEYILRQ